MTMRSIYMHGPPDTDVWPTGLAPFNGRNAERLLKLSEDILEASRIETGRLKMYAEEVNLNRLIPEAIEYK